VRKLLSLMAAVIVLLPVCACGSDDSDDGGKQQGAGGSMASGGSTGSGGEPQAGFTNCGEQQCQPGQSCFNFVCVSGCASSVNCLANQTCENVDDVSHVGTCTDGAPAKDCDAFISKCQACGGGEECSPVACEGYSAECVECLISSNCDDSLNCPCG
jgi:hypothetical protein